MLSECPEGTFSSGVGNGPCETCPANSDATRTGLTICPCIKDNYRAPYEAPSDPCTREYYSMTITELFLGGIQLWSS